MRNNEIQSSIDQDTVYQVLNLIKERKYTGQEISNMTGVDPDDILTVIYVCEWMNENFEILSKGSYRKTRTKYTEDQIYQVCQLLSEGEKTQMEISKITDVDNNVVSAVWKYIAWKHIGSQYGFQDNKTKYYMGGR